MCKTRSKLYSCSLGFGVVLYDHVLHTNISFLYMIDRRYFLSFVSLSFSLPLPENLHIENVEYKSIPKTLVDPREHTWFSNPIGTQLISLVLPKEHTTN